jgi:hypothetical protein
MVRTGSPSFLLTGKRSARRESRTRTTQTSRRCSASRPITVQQSTADWRRELLVSEREQRRRTTSTSKITLNSSTTASFLPVLVSVPDRTTTTLPASVRTDEAVEEEE